MQKKSRRLGAPRAPQLKTTGVAPAIVRNSALMGISAAMLMPLCAAAQSSPANEAATLMPAITVEGEKIDPNPNAEVGSPYKAKTSGDERHTRPLAETPQTITVITKDAIDDSGKTDLRQILDGQPGITLGTGENGNQFGDRYIIRGQEARSDVFVDGLRDPGMTTRESFAIEQLEITKGPNSSFAGRGSAGGAINAITKQATLDYDFYRLSAGFGTDKYQRYTLDANKGFTDHFALRANALYGDEDVPGRSPASRTRKGLALSGLYEVNRDLSITLDYYGLRAKDSPDLGYYLVGTVPNRVPASYVPVYTQAQDFQRSDVDTFTARIKYSLAPNLKLTNLTRYGTSDNGYVVTGARSATGYLGANTYQTGSLSTHNGWQDVNYFANQTNLRWDTDLFGKKNEFIFSAEYSDHHVVKGTYNINNAGAFNCRTSATTRVNNSYCTTDALGNTANGLNTLLNRQITPGYWNADWRVKTFSLAAMDTVDLTDRLTAFGGVRADRFDFELDTRSNTGVVANYPYSGTIWNGHFGLAYKLNPKGIVYASMGSSADINGGESDVGTNSGYGGVVIYNGSVADSKPERSFNFELGTKWNLLDDKLLATAAIFQTTKKDVTEGADYDTVGTFNTGKNRVRGVEFGLVGNVTDKLTTQVGVAFMKSKVLESATASNLGKPLSNFADRSASAQFKYQATSAFSFGAAARYESQRCAGQPDTAAGIDTYGRCTQPVPSYTVYDLFAAYRFNKHLDMRVNVLNVADKDYYLAAYRSGSFLYKGDGRALRVTFDYEF
ncbi:MAG: TonB-dependent receptor [Gammaproteobacteria bacterium]|nr:TonB-dependent receptor [Gammaproteobacteria bacterium]MBU1440658.1 TonB-dependent receptor [Gammaproteobacteria bacterium]MBU2287141.1 TonB-dependent receptor [Gammaproteobacteria bacterium]MBU2408866.1 TonB-dependent receptor [Gammaproteobacteria bacterium]